MKKLNLIVLSLLALLSLQLMAQEKKTIKVACVGNSITEGSGLKNPQQESYPSVLSDLLGEEYEVRNFGYSGRTLLNKGDRPYMKEDRYRNALAFNPDIVTIKLGTNDSKPQNWQYKDEFKKDLETMVTAFQELPSKPEIYLCLPAPSVAVTWGINDSIVYNEVIPYIREVAASKNTHLIDLYTPLKPYPEYFPDNVHPNAEGAKRIAEVIYETLTGRKFFSVEL